MMLHELLEKSKELGASDMLLVAGAAPTVFVNGQWRPLGGELLTAAQVTKAVESALTEDQKRRLHEMRDLDMGLSVDSAGRFRVNVHYQRGGLAAAFRAIPTKIPSFDELGLPEQVKRCADFPNGLVLVTGPTGQGKSTTLAALVNHMNQTRRCHIITIEDPIEFGFSHGTCLIEQRQIGDDSPSFALALRHALRQRPDVILIGEMRDLETISTALTAAETGHLVLASIHTSGAAQTLARIIDVFPASQQPHVRTQVAASLRAIICQSLVRDHLNDRLAPATELLITNSALRRAIRDNETHLIYGMLETGRCHGMHTLEQSLAELILSGRVAPADALAAARDPARLSKLVPVDLDRGWQIELGGPGAESDCAPPENAKPQMAAPMNRWAAEELG